MNKNAEPLLGQFIKELLIRTNEMDHFTERNTPELSSDELIIANRRFIKRVEQLIAEDNRYYGRSNALEDWIYFNGNRATWIEEQIVQDVLNERE